MTESETARARWLALDRPRRRRIARAVRKGQAVDDPRDAPYAVGFADASLEWLSWRARFRPFHLVLLVLLLAEIGLTWRWRPAAFLYPLLVIAFLRLRAPRLRRKIAAAREANRRLLAQLALEPVAIELPGRALFQPRSRLRRRLTVGLSLVLAAVVALSVTVIVLATERAHRWAADANRICRHEQTRLAASQTDGLGRAEARRRANVIEEEALLQLERLSPKRRQTRLQTQFLAWKRYELELHLWLLSGIERRDRNVIREAQRRARSARERVRGLANRLHASRCV
jgi:hypothetical protein